MDGHLDRGGKDDRLEAALSELRRERRRTDDELEAFKAFEDRVRGISPEENAFESRQAVGVSASVETTGLDQVRHAYESTVMSAPHYFEEYDDGYVGSLIEEFSPDLAAALTDGTEFNERCKRTLLSSISNSQSARESLLEVIDSERKSVSESKSDLVPLLEECSEIESMRFENMRFGTLDAYRARLEVIDEHCDRIAGRRQNEIFDQRRIRWLPSDVTDVTMYFYQDLDFEYPVISLVADLADSIAAIRMRIERAMMHCNA